MECLRVYPVVQVLSPTTLSRWRYVLLLMGRRRSPGSMPWDPRAWVTYARLVSHQVQLLQTSHLETRLMWYRYAHVIN